MTQRSNHRSIAIARPHGQDEALRAARLKTALILTASAALILVLVLITGHSSAEYGFV